MANIFHLMYTRAHLRVLEEGSTLSYELFEEWLIQQMTFKSKFHLISAVHVVSRLELLN